MRCYFWPHHRYSFSQYKRVKLLLVPALGVFVFVAMAALIDNSLTLADAQVTGPQAQSVNNNTSNNQGALNQEQQSPLLQEVSPTVKITYPEKGQQVPVGELTVNGISSDTVDTDCEVFVILNGIKPYQPVNPKDNNDDNNSDDGESSSSGGEVKDYATWMYTFTPKYALIKEGENKITSKISCQHSQGNTSSLASSSNLKHYSVNLTGFDNSASNTTTATSPLLPQNTSRTLSNPGVNSSDILNNATIFVVPMPSDLLPRLNDLDSNGQGDDNDRDDDADSNDDNGGGGPDNTGKGNGKAKGHEKNDKS